MEIDDLEFNEDLEASHHRWLLSYADLVTLLFSLFVVLFASSFAGKQKAGEISTAVREALGERVPVERLEHVKQLLDSRLSKAIQAGTAEVRLEQRGLVIRLKDISFFPPGDTEFRPEAGAMVDEIAKTIAPLPNAIAVEGHSDATAIHNSRFRDNWELSSARSLAMLRYLSKNYDISQQRLSATAYSDTRPLSDNTSAEGRAQNRRVDIVILSEIR